MNMIKNILMGSIGQTVKTIGDTVRKFVTTDSDRLELNAKFEEILQRRDSEIEGTIRKELESKERVLIAELQQGDNFTKRARPSVVYAGLAFIALNYSIVPAIQSFTGQEIQPFPLPTEFWVGWSGIVMTWSIGRSAEKRGSRNKLVSIITGS